MTLTPKIRQDIVEFLSEFPSLHDKEGRKAILLNAGLDQQIPTIDLSGNTFEFVSRLVEQLAQFGTLPGREPALIYLLQSLESQVGLEKQEQINTFCQRLTAQRSTLLEECPYRSLFAFREKDEPAKAQGVQIEDGLTDRILDVVGDEPGNLPLLEFALTELWNRQTNGTLTHYSLRRDRRRGTRPRRVCRKVYTNLNEDEHTRAQRI